MAVLLPEVWGVGMSITVGELIKLLQEQPRDAPVETEGCDCHGTCGGVELMSWGDVLIRREEDE